LAIDFPHAFEKKYDNTHHDDEQSKALNGGVAEIKIFHARQVGKQRVDHGGRSGSTMGQSRWDIKYLAGFDQAQQKYDNQDRLEQGQGHAAK
jgi:hypothetical protein